MVNRRLATLLTLTLLLCSCTLAVVQGSGHIISETRNVSDFDRVEVCCGMRLVLTQGDTTQLTLEADDNILPEIETVVRGNTLTVRFRTTLGSLNLRTSHPVTVYLQMPAVHGVTLSGGSTLETQTINSDDLSLEFSGGSQGMIGNLHADRVGMVASGGSQVEIDQAQSTALDLEVSGGGRATINAGTTTNQQIVASGGSRYLAAALESETASLEVSGGGEARVWVTEDLHVQASGGSTVEYTGDPTIDQQLSGGSELHAVNR